MAKTLEKHQEIEKSIIKTYRKEIWAKFIKAINDYKLIKDGDSIMVCISGGKDSFLLAKCIEEVMKHGKVHFNARYVCMNPGYSEANLNLIKKNADILNLNLEIFDSNIFESVEVMDAKSPCYMCARMRRGYLYSKAQELGCNKIALGHHFNDVIETTLLSLFYGAEIKTMMPKLHSDNFEGIELIRPLFLVHEDYVRAWCTHNDLHFINCACKFTEGVSNKEEISKRKEMKELIKHMLKSNKEIDNNIFKALDNVNLNCVLGTKRDGNYKSFLEDYDNQKDREK